MKSFAIKAVLCVTAVLGLTIASFVGLAGLVLWRAERAPVRIDIVAPIVEWAATKSSPAVRRCSIGAITLSKRPDERKLDVTIENLELVTEANRPLASFSKGVFGFDADDLFAARLGPQTLIIDNAVIRVVRAGAEPLGERRLDLDYGSTAQGPIGVFQSLTGGPYLRDAFQKATLNKTKVEFFDEATNNSWTAEEATANIVKTENGYDAQIWGDFDIGDKNSRLDFAATYDIATDLIVADIEVTEAPIADIAEIFLGASPSVLTSPVTGRGAISISGEGTVIASQIDGVAGKGVLEVGGIRTEVNSLALSMKFDASANQFVIKSFQLDTDVSAFGLSGEVGLTGDRFAPEGMDFRLEIAEFRTAAGNFFDAPLQLEKTDLEGNYQFEPRRITLQELNITLPGANLFGALIVDAPVGQSLGLKGELSLSGALSKSEVMKIWPKPAAWAARRFVEEQVLEADFDDVQFQIDLPSGAMDGGAIMPDEAMELSFRAFNGELIYAPGMTPLTEMIGIGVLGGNSFRFDVSDGRVDNIDIINGSAEMPILRPKGAPATFRFTAEGDAGEILRVLNQPPLQVLRTTSFSPDQFDGRGTVSAQIIRPNQRDVDRKDYRYTATADFGPFVIRDFVQETSLNGKKANVLMDSKGMTISGSGNFGEAPIDVVWRQSFTGDEDPTDIKLDGLLDSRLGDVLGIPMRQFIRGDAPFSAEIRGDLLDIREVSFEADFRDAALVLEALDWRKSVGEPARAFVELEFEDRKPTNASIAMSGDGLGVDGKVNFDSKGAISTAKFDKFQLRGSMDLAFSATRGAERYLEVIVAGRELDLEPMIVQLLNNEQSDDQVVNELDVQTKKEGTFLSFLRSTALTGRIDRMRLRGGVTLHDAALDFRHGAERLETLDFVGLDDNGGRLSLHLEESGDAADERIARRSLELRTDDLGAFLRGLFEINSVRNGRSVIEFDVTEGATFSSGKLEARDFQIEGTPLLAKIFAAGSFPGVADLVTGEGIAMGQAFGDFSFGDGVLTIGDFRAAGPSIGLSAQGNVAFGQNAEIDISGAVAPAYQVNSFLGKAPLIGDLFVNRDGEGVIAVSYAVSGSASEPVIAVNPLSALTPGLLRRMFETPKDIGADNLD